MTTSSPTPTATSWRTSRVWRSGAPDRDPPPPPPAPRAPAPRPPVGRRGRAGRVTRVGSSPSSKNDNALLLAGSGPRKYGGQTGGGVVTGAAHPERDEARGG